MSPELSDIIEDHMLTLDGYDDCIVGVAERCGMPNILAYDADKVIAKLVERDGMTEEEASEFFSFNISGAYMGEGTPIFIYPILKLE